ncbi:MAG: hypothetical protein JSS81_27240 [Acidobacteria bacterium]|nr:hypothetical protein [Acidobacteriota bacterium]
MKKVVFLTVLLTLAIGVCGQKPKAPVRPAVKTVPVQQTVWTEVPDAEWGALAKALADEDWNKAAALAARDLERLPADNDRKQLAQLRYMYLYAQTGRILDANARADATAAETAWNELDVMMANFIGKEFVLPPRRFVEDCDKKLNVICRVRDTPNAFRTTATNIEGNAIHSFDYVVFETPVDIKEFDEKPTFIGGILRKADYNEDKTKPWVLRLYFNKGFVRVVVK